MTGLILSTLIFQKNELDAWALSRDAVAYSLGLFCLVIFFANDTIQWYEALTMVLLYMAYVAGKYEELL